MNQTRLDFILETIKPQDCKIEFLQDVCDLAPHGSCYRPDIKTVFVLPLDKHTNIESFAVLLTDKERSAFQDRCVLHEIGHHVTWNPQWRLYGAGDGMISDQKTAFHTMCSDNLYGAEYLAEKFCREQCKKNGWLDLLEISNKYIRHMLEQMVAPVPHGDSWGYGYMILRIAREEGL